MGTKASFGSWCTNDVKQHWETVSPMQTQQQNMRESNFYFLKCNNSISQCDKLGN